MMTTTTTADHEDNTPTAPSQFSTLLGSTIESIIHELLFSRSIYPPESFVLSRHLGVRCHASRVPPVGDYISSFLRVAIPAIVSGVGDIISLIILEEEVVIRRGSGGRAVGERTGGTKTVERFAFDFQVADVIGCPEEVKLEQNSNRQYYPEEIEDLQEQALARDTDLALEARSQLERSLRECLLQVLSLRRRRRRKDERAENMSFKLCLHVRGEEKMQGNAEIDGTKEGRRSCPELMKAMKKGEWLQPKESSCLFSSTSKCDAQQNIKGLLRPIKDINLPSCGVRMQMGMEVNPF